MTCGDPWRYGNGLVDAWVAYQYVTGQLTRSAGLNVGIGTNYGYYHLCETMRDRHIADLTTPWFPAPVNLADHGFGRVLQAADTTPAGL